MTSVKKAFLFAGIPVLCLAAILLILLLPRGEDLSKPVRRAASLIKSAQKAEKTSYARAVKLYEQALATLEETSADLKEGLIPKIRLKAEAEQDPLACAYLIARTLKKPEWVAWALCGIGAAYFESGQNDRASEILFHAHREAEKTADEYEKALVLTHIALEHAEAGQPDKASMIFSQALQAAEQVAPPSGGAFSDEQSSREQARVDNPNGANERVTTRPSQSSEAASRASLQSVANGQASNRPPDPQKLKPLFRKEMALSMMVLLCADRGRYDMAVQAAEMQEYPGRRFHDLSRIARGYLSASQTQKAVEIIRLAHEAAGAIEKPFNKALSLAEVSKVYAQAGEHGHALKTAEGIEDTFCKTSALASIAESLSTAGHSENALELLRRAGSEAETVEDFWQAGALADVSRGYASVWEFGQAVRVAQRIQQAQRRGDSMWVKAGALLSIAAKCAEAEQREKSSEILSLALRVAKTIDYPGHKAEALASVARTYAQLGEKRKASEILSQAVQAAKSESDAESRASMLSNIAEEFLHAGDYRQALRIARMMPSVLEKFLVLAEIEVKLGEYEAAIEAVEGINDTRQKAKSLSHIAVKLAETGKYVNALHVAASIKNTFWKTTALTEIGSVYVKSGRKPSAAENEILREIVRTIR